LPGKHRIRSSEQRSHASEPSEVGSVSPAARTKRESVGTAMIDQESLRLLIHRKIWDGRLPCDRAPGVLGAPGVGGCCDGCDEPLATTQMGMSVPWPSEKTFAHLHADCYQIWNLLTNGGRWMTKPNPERCCCGGLYAEHGGASNSYCPTGQRALCEECISEGGRICPTHTVPLLRSLTPDTSRSSTARSIELRATLSPPAPGLTGWRLRASRPR